MVARKKHGSGTASYLRRPLDAALEAPSHLAILRVLRDRATGMTGREIARAAGLSHMAAHDSLARLEGMGVVRRLPAGRAYLFELNRKHWLVKRALLPLLEAEREFRKAIVARLRKKFGRKILAGAIYGSAARGEEGTGSDLDVCLVVGREGEKAAARTAAGELADEMADEFGMRLSALVYTKSEFRRGYRSKNPYFRDVVREGERFAGKELEEVIRG